MSALIGHGIKTFALCKDVRMEESESLSDLVETPVDLRPDLTLLGISEYDKGICEDTVPHRNILRKNKLAWRQIYDSTGRPTGQIEVLSVAMQEGRALATLNDKKSILDDPNDPNSDYQSGIALMYNMHAEEMVPPWIMNATRDYYRIEEQREQNPGKKVRPNLVSYPGRCRFIKSDGIRCMLWHAGRAADDGLCRTHQGALNANTGVGAVERARNKAQTIAPYAIDVLEEMMNTATSEPARIQAANSLLDRAGVRGGADIDVNVQVEMKPAAEVVRERLERLKKGHVVQEELTATPVDITEVPHSDGNGDMIPVDAEIVEDTENDHR